MTPGSEQTNPTIHHYECQDCGAELDWVEIDTCPSCGSDELKEIHVISDGGEVSESTGHGPFEDAVIHAFGDEIPARECLSCGLKVAEGDDGFQLHSCQRIQRFNGKEIATDGGQEVGGVAQPPLTRFDLSGIPETSDGLLWVYLRDDGWYVDLDADIAQQEATGYPVGELVDHEDWEDGGHAEDGGLRVLDVSGRDAVGPTLEPEAHAIVDVFNSATPDYAPELEWFGMSADHETMEEQFVFEAENYIDRDGLAALREHGRQIEYIESYDYDGEVGVSINIAVKEEVPTDA